MPAVVTAIKSVKQSYELSAELLQMNVSVRGRAFLSSNGIGVFERPQGPAGEAMRGNPTMPVILRVDAGKLTFRREPTS